MIQRPERLFHVTRSLLMPGECVQPGNWGRLVLGTGGRHPLFFRELYLERVRKERYPSVPSRLESAFAFSNNAVAESFSRMAAPKDQSGRPEGGAMHIYVVEAAKPSDRATRADMAWIDALPSVHSPAAADSAIDRYWQGKPESQSPKWEWLLAGPLIVKERVTGLLDDQLNDEAP